MVTVKEIEDAVVVANTNLNAKVHGSGDIEYKGMPTQKDVRIFGSVSYTHLTLPTNREV